MSEEVCACAVGLSTVSTSHCSYARVSTEVFDMSGAGAEGAPRGVFCLRRPVGVRKLRTEYRYDMRADHYHHVSQVQ